MAATIYRYSFKGPNIEAIKSNVDPAILVDMNSAMPKTYVDISLDPGPPLSSAQEDLDSIMFKLGWEPFAINPDVPLKTSNNLILQANTVGAVTVPLLDISGNEFAAELGTNGYLFNIRVIGVRTDTPDVTLSQFLTATGHVDGPNFILDDSGTGITGSIIITMSTPGGLVLRGEVTGTVGQTIKWLAVYEWIQTGT